MAARVEPYAAYSQVISDLNSGKLASLYFASGSDYYLYRQFIVSLRSAFKKKYGENADLVQRWGADLKAAPDLSSLMSGGGLFSSASLVLLHEIQGSGKSVKTKLSEILGNIPADTVVLAHYSISEYRKAKWLDDIQKIARVVPLSIPESTVLPRIVSQIATDHGVELQDSATHRLIELSGGELAIIDNELEKISIYLHDSKESVGKEMVDRISGSVENAQVSQFIDAVSIRDRKLAIQTLAEIHHRGKEGLPYLVALLYNRLIQLMALQESIATRKTIGQGVTSYYFLKDLETLSRNYKLDELQIATQALADIDREFRLGSMDMLSAFSGWVSKVV
jgi:DNA polymerase III delta subunit